MSRPTTPPRTIIVDREGDAYEREAERVAAAANAVAIQCLAGLLLAAILIGAYEAVAAIVRAFG